MISALRFVSYRLDHLRLKAKADIATLAGDPVEASNNEDEWDIKLGVRTPQYYSKRKIYIGGVDCGLFMFPKEMPKDERKPDASTVFVEVGISGAFDVEAGRLEKEIEDKLVRVQIPAILFPYVRASVTLLLASAGVGSVILPLINMNEVGKNALKDKEIQVIDE
jgi:hypothetical protein